MGRSRVTISMCVREEKKREIGLKGCRSGIVEVRWALPT